jgi:uncharacterized protein
MAALKVEVVYARPGAHDAVHVSIESGATVADAVRASGIAIDAPSAEFGIFGKRVPAEMRVADGDRVEIYRALALDPKEARRQRARTTYRNRSPRAGSARSRARAARRR